MRGGHYYTGSRRVGGRVVREYAGTGVAAELAARLDALESERRLYEREAERARERPLDATGALLREFCDATDKMLEAALLGAGYRRHDRGAWRR